MMALFIKLVMVKWFWVLLDRYIFHKFHLDSNTTLHRRGIKLDDVSLLIFEEYIDV